ncbi:MAG: Dam family site-specific DNA-(adenine-N6)-methyltransferase [Ignavibacteriales bacterium]|nr:Dam family site-specific DNA-(adenine-N6)-methyltransferase [Ignavibacteriales bacterium]
MQLTLENKYISYYPPKAQLLKWIGNKQKFAVEITKYFPTDYGRYFEPFLGSGAILATIVPHSGLGSDTFKPLMEIWMMLKKDPKTLIGWYAERRKRIGKEAKEEVYEAIKASYNKQPNGPDFLYLSRACYGGIVRFRKADGYMSTPCGIHNPIPSESFAKRVTEWSNRVKNVDFANCDYKEAFAQARFDDLIYCDPPYSHSQSILYGAQDFKLEELLTEIEKAKIKGVKVALSIDGKKKSGSLLCNLPIPDDLFQNEIFIDCGRSMLRRFQLIGQTLEREDVSDRLLLTY